MKKLYINVYTDNEADINRILGDHGLGNISQSCKWIDDSLVVLNIGFFDINNEKMLTDEINVVSSCYYGV